MTTLAKKTVTTSDNSLLSASSSFEYNIINIILYNNSGSSVEVLVNLTDKQNNIFNVLKDIIDVDDTSIISLSGGLYLDKEDTINFIPTVDNVNVMLLGEVVRRN